MILAFASNVVTPSVAFPRRAIKLRRGYIAHETGQKDMSTVLSRTLLNRSCSKGKTRSWMVTEKMPALKNVYPICAGVRPMPPRSILVYANRVNMMSNEVDANDTMKADTKTERGAGRDRISEMESVLGGGGTSVEAQLPSVPYEHDGTACGALMFSFLLSEKLSGRVSSRNKYPDNSAARVIIDEMRQGR